jgi:hypothetical protein
MPTKQVGALWGISKYLNVVQIQQEPHFLKANVKKFVISTLKSKKLFLVAW